MISVEEALQRVADACAPLPAETVSLAEAAGRVLAEDVVSRLTQPPSNVSAMDGYAVRAADVARVPVSLPVVTEIAAGAPADQPLQPGQAARIFTGAALPEGADAVVIQENTERAGDQVTIQKSVAAGTFVRRAGLDFKAGDVGLRAGARLTPRDIGLAAAMNVPWLAVRRRPRVTILTTGDELALPGDPMTSSQIISSNGFSLAAAVSAFGGEPLLLGIAPDQPEALKAMAAGAKGSDLFVTSGGASVGDHDLVQAVLGEDGLEVDFWKIAMRPGKPLIFGRIGATPMIGVPGNPVSTLVCAALYVRTAMNVMLGQTPPWPVPEPAVLGADLGPNDQRQDYLRATLSIDDQGRRVTVPYERQDSSMLGTLTEADCLLIRAPRAPAAAVGDIVSILPTQSEHLGI